MKTLRMMTHEELFQDYFVGCDINASESVLSYLEGKDIYMFIPYYPDRVYFMTGDNTHIVIKAMEDSPVPEALRAAGFRSNKVKLVAGICDQKVIHVKAEMKGYHKDLWSGINWLCQSNLTEPSIRIDSNRVVWVQHYSNTKKPTGCWKKAGEILSHEVGVCNLLDIDNVSAASALLCEAFDICYQDDVDSAWLTRDDTEPDTCGVEDVSIIKLFGFSNCPAKESYEDIRTVELHFLVSTAYVFPGTELDFDERWMKDVISYFTGK